MTILADYPAYTVLALPEVHEISLTEDKGYCRTSSVTFRVESFPGDKYSYLRGFVIGCDEETGVWAYGKGSCISDTPDAKGFCFGISLGDVINIEGTEYRVEPASNHNIKLSEV